MARILFLLVAVSSCLVAQGIGEANDEESKLIVDGVDVMKLDEADLYAFIEADDVLFAAELDIYVGNKTLEETANTRPKRNAIQLLRLAWSAGRYMFKNVLPRATPVVKRAGKRLTTQYFKRGSYNSAVRDFHRFKPTNVQSRIVRDGKYQGMRLKTGQVGDTKMTVRSKSSYGRPTLEFRNGNRVRKFRYESRKSLRKNHGR